MALPLRAHLANRRTPDIAAVAFRTLTQEGHSRREYVLTGPESLTQAEQISVIGGALGRSLAVEEISPDEARRELAGIFPLFVANMLLDAWGASVGQPAYATDTVEEVTGSPAERFANGSPTTSRVFDNRGMVEETRVPCNGRTECCRHNSAVFLHPDRGDDVDSYQVRAMKRPESDELALFSRPPRRRSVFISDRLAARSMTGGLSSAAASIAESII